MAKVAKIWPDLFKQYHELCRWFKDYYKQNEQYKRNNTIGEQV